MSLAKFRKVHSKTGAGRFVVSEGVAPSAYLLPHPGLPTWYLDSEDDRFEIVIPKGTILSVVADANGDARIVPANGTSSSKSWGDVMPSWDPLDGATPTSTSGSSDTVTVAARSIPIGCAQYDLYRPFDKGTSQGAGFITHGYVEYPMVAGINDDVTVGSLIRSDFMGRPVAAAAADFYNSSAVYSYLQVGKVVEVEKFATNFDDGLLSYMQLPSDPGALKTVYELTRSGSYSGKLGIRANLDVYNVIGAFRVNLTL
jgi:hypothetical protein